MDAYASPEGASNYVVFEHEANAADAPANQNRKTPQIAPVANYFVLDTNSDNKDDGFNLRPSESLSYSNSDENTTGALSYASLEETDAAVKLVESENAEREAKKAGVTSSPSLRESTRLITSHYRDWNEDFQQAISMPDSDERALKLAEIARDFEHTAVHFAELVVSEMFLPPEHKTVKPVGVGGIAGGAKFSIKGILLKFVTDTELAPGFFMYGGKMANDTFAYKAAGHELKGLSAIFAAIERLRLPIHVPLTCLVDFRGFRLIAVATLPINKGTIIYGSSDGGISVHDDDPKFSDLAATLFSDLNLQPHWVGPVGGAKRLYGPGDIEGHRGLDGRYYLLDYARVFPPEAPARGSREVFYRCLRAEFVKIHGPLNSDAFSGWGNSDVKFKDHCEAVRAKTEHLYTVVVKEFAEKVLVKEPSVESLEGLSEDGDPLKVAPSLTALMHSHGINMRHLGLVLKFTKNETWKQIIKTEMVARVLKTLLREKLRAIGYATHQSANHPYKEAVVKIFKDLTALNENRLNEFWTVTIKKLLMEKYYIQQAGDTLGDFLTLEERRNDYDFFQSIRMRLLFQRIEVMMDQRLAKRFVDLLPTRKTQDRMIKVGAVQLSALPPFIGTDLVSLPLKSKRLPFIELAEARLAIKQAWAQCNRRFAKKITLDAFSLSVALRSLQSASSALTSSAELRCKMAEAFVLLALNARTITDGYPARDRELQYLARAQEEAEATLLIRNDYPDAHFILGMIHAAQVRNSDAVKSFTKALELGGTYMRDRILDAADRSLDFWDYFQFPLESVGLPLNYCRSLVEHLSNRTGDDERRVLARARILLCKAHLHSAALQNFDFIKHILVDVDVSKLNDPGAVLIKRAAEELERALAIPGHGPTAFDDLWDQIFSNHSRVSLCDFILMASESDAVASALFTGLAKVKSVNLSTWTRWRQQVKEIRVDWARFLPALDSFRCDRHMSVEAIKSLVDNCKSLTSIDFCLSGSLQNDSLNALIEGLKTWKLKSITFESVVPGTKVVLEAIAKGSSGSLQKLSLKSIPRIDSEGLGLLLKAVGSTLTHLELNQIDDLDQALIFPTLNAYCKELKTLVLGGYMFKDESFGTLSLTLSRLTSLSLSCSQLGVKAVDSITSLCENIRHLSLDGLQRAVTTAHMAKIGSSPFAAKLESLHMRDMSSGVTGDFFGALKSCANLKKIHLEMMGGMQGSTFGASLAALPALEEFIADNNGGRWWNDEQFESFIAGAKNLRVLRIAQVRSLTWASLQHLFTRAKSLRELDISAVQMDPQWTKTLAADDCVLRASETNVGLTHLLIQNTPTNRFGLHDIVKSCPNLEVLNISQVCFTEHGLLELSKLKKLRSLTLSMSEFQSSSVFVQIVKKLPLLQRLEIVNEADIRTAEGELPNPYRNPTVSRHEILDAAANKSLELSLVRFV